MDGPSEFVNGMTAAALVGVDWRKSARSGPQGNCVEFAALPDGVHVAMRNSRHPTGPALLYRRDEAAALLADLKDGAFDHLL
ncbi:MAG TPA: DUF397 domain-containing protein [Kineosporiaceae bacterium]